jgi:hypothetical protein
MVPRLRHIVVRAHDVVAAGRFYESLGLTNIVDGMEPIGPVKVYSDGHVGIAIMPVVEGHPEGFDHCGFVVESLDTTIASIEGTGAEFLPRNRRPEEREGYVDLPPGASEGMFQAPGNVFVEVATREWHE